MIDNTWHVNAIEKGRIVGDASAPTFDKLLISAANSTVATAYRAKEARLIAAAPELLAALTSLLACPELNADDMETGTWDAITQAVHVLRKVQP